MDLGSDTTFNDMQRVKRRFFAMRNGAVADSMRKSGASYRIIFGLNLPQITEIAREFGINRDLALNLRNNTSTRESMLLAPMIFPSGELTQEVAWEWLRTAPTTEVVDVACLKLIKKLDKPAPLLEKLSQSNESLMRYSAIRTLVVLWAPA